MSVVRGLECYIEILGENEPLFKHCRGKGDDSAANMKGKKVAYKIEF